ncbi:MAG: Gfo/Idh/MocA family oxidoreductase [Actinophytocola sp.]
MCRDLLLAGKHVCCEKPLAVRPEDADDGGRLLVLRSASARDVRHALPPLLGSSAVLVRSATSWHAAEPPGPRSPVRRSVTATFWRGAGPAPRTG